MNASSGRCQVKTQIHAALNLQWKRSLNGHTPFADVHDFTEIEDLATRTSIQAGVGGSVNLLPHPPAASTQRRRQFPAGLHRVGTKGLHTKSGIHITAAWQCFIGSLSGKGALL